MRAGRGGAHARRASPLRVALALLGLCGLLIAWSLVRASQLQYDAHRALACRHGAHGCANLTRLSAQYAPAGKPIFTFRVCNGLTNQRLALITGLCIAKLLDRDVLLPHVTLRDTPHSPVTVPLSRLYDVAALRAALPATVLFEDPQRPLWSVTHRVERAMKPSTFYVDLAARSTLATLLGFDCTLFALDFESDEALVAHAWAVHRALRFVTAYDELAAKVLQRLRARSAFVTVLHGRFEREWREHCQRWTYGFNCMATADDMLHAVRTHSRSEVLYVAQRFGESVAPYAALARAGYELVTMADVLPDVQRLPHGASGGVELAAVDFLVADAADLFIGNSVSTFSALQILARREGARAAALANGGGVPLVRFLPPLSTVRERRARPLSWVFTFTDTGSALYHDHLLALVQSAVERTTLRAVCIFSGSADSPTARWLRAKGVTLVRHELSFAAELARIDLSKEWRTPLAASLAMVISTFQRVDIPLLAELAAEEVVLYTDVDVLFVADVRLAAIPIPDYLACGPEDKPTLWSPCNAGVLLLNVANMRHTHAALVAYILARPGLKFPQGPLDQGALNGFYHGKITRLPLELNWKPYWPHSAAAQIVHFHGPKPVDLDAYLRNGTVTNRLYRKLLRKCDEGRSCGAHLGQYLQLLERAKRTFLQS